MMKNTTTIKRYSSAILLPSFEERFKYLKLDGKVSEQTFGGHRYLNQRLYNSEKWKRVRREIIIRDNGCDLACPEYPIFGNLLIHHIEPITIDDILEERSCIFDQDNLICISYETHNQLHYGSSENVSFNEFTIRKMYDTCPWR